MSMSGHPLPTPECIDVSSVTPDSVKSPTPPPVASNAPDTASASSNNTEGCPTAAEDRSGSPPPSCPICLGTYKNKCFTDSCLHQFCFNCLLEWSKIKAECPLCKQSFKSIIHNVKSEREFEEYLVQQPLHYNLMLSEPIRFSYSTTLRVRPSQSEALQRLFLHHPSLTDRYIYPRNERPNVRRRIYERGLYALPLFDITGRARECSAEFYRANPAQIHRLIPFLNREAIHVIQDSRSVSSLLQRATEILTTHDITSAEFRRLVEPYFRENTVHFIHELYNFARSPYDLYGYDNNVQYSQDYNMAMHTQETDSQQQQQGMRTRSNAAGASTSAPSSSSAALWSASNPNNTHHSNAVVNVLSSSSSSMSGSDDEAVCNRSSATTTAAVGVVRRENVSVIQTNPATASTSAASHPLQQPAPQIKTEQQRVESVIRTAGEPSVKIELSDTDSDECQFVLERKPPHLRTPEYVSLNSEEDSDVVFVNQSTDGPVMPSKELPRHLQPIHGTASLSPSSRLSLMEDSRHMPTFMPYMYGMDAAEPGPSTATGVMGMAGPSSAAAAAAAPGPVDMKHAQNASKLNLKHEDPMLAGPSSSFAGVGAQRRKRKSQRRHPQSGAGGGMLHWSSSEDDIEGYAAEDLHGGPSGNVRRRRIAPPTSYAASSTADTESSHDEYKASTSSRAKAVPKKKPQTPKSLRMRKRGSRGSGKVKREALRAMRFREEQERLRVQQEKVVVQQEDQHSTQTSNSSSESSSSSNSSNSGTDEEINVRDETVTHQDRQQEPQGNEMEDIHVGGHQSRSSSRNEEEEDEEEDDEDVASNQGSVATSASQRTTSMGSDSEEIDVQNDELD